MRLKRPAHLAARQIRGRAFSEPITILRTEGEYNVYGEYHESTTSVPAKCATAPVTNLSDSRVRILAEEGITLSAMRHFWTVEDLEPVKEGQSAGDIVEFVGEQWRVRVTQRWGGFSESLAVRIENQP